MKVKFEVLTGKTLTDVKVSFDQILFIVNDGTIYSMQCDTRYSPEYAEAVTVDDINGELEDIKNTPILSAYKATKDNGYLLDRLNWDTWKYTFYHIYTSKGSITITWKSSVPGYYSVSVDLEKIEHK